MNANAEALRDCFVNSEGKSHVEIVTEGILCNANYGAIPQKLVDEVTRQLKDPSVADWLLPNFTTTSESDVVAACVSTMSTLQAYFEYYIVLACGIPRVTLLGTTEDWKQLRAKIDSLPLYDLEDGRMVAWHNLLRPILDQFVQCSQGKPDVLFWDNVCTEMPYGSRPFLNGWLTVFTAFAADGQWQGDVADGSSWPKVYSDRIPTGVVCAPVSVKDGRCEHETLIFAGQFAYETCSSGLALKPRNDWCIAAVLPNSSSLDHAAQQWRPRMTFQTALLPSIHLVRKPTLPTIRVRPAGVHASLPLRPQQINISASSGSAKLVSKVAVVPMMQCPMLSFYGVPVVQMRPHYRH